MLIVCPLHDVEAELKRSRPARLVTLLSPTQPEPPAPEDMPRLTLRFHDITESRDELIAPSRNMVEALLAFGDAWLEPEPMLVHCWMGISRSTAAAIALAAAADPSRNEMEIAIALRTASPSATPNALMVALADDLLGRQGRLISATAAIGRGVDATFGGRFNLPLHRRLGPAPARAG
jgi:predicted protein tyrosine phosphatase